MPKNKKVKIAEFDFISRYMLPLTGGFAGALQLQDDIAIIPKDIKTDYILTLDTIAEGTHFLKTATPKQIASKLIRSNLSDIASCGGSPKFYLLTGNLSAKMDHNWLREFTVELSATQKQYGFTLLGGDTIRSNAQKFFSVTMIGEVPKGKALLRSGAKTGDDIYVSGTIGEAWAGLQFLTKNLRLPKNKQKYYIDKHYVPQPQIALGKKLLTIATSCTDVSDGLLKDLNNILQASNKSAVIDKNSIPLALAGEKYFMPQITAGDDYQLIFTAKPMHGTKIKRLGAHKIGKIVANSPSEKIMIFDKDRKIKIKRLGYEH